MAFFPVSSETLQIRLFETFFERLGIENLLSSSSLTQSSNLKSLNPFIPFSQPKINTSTSRKMPFLIRTEKQKMYGKTKQIPTSNRFLMNSSMLPYSVVEYYKISFFYS